MERERTPEPVSQDPAPLLWRRFRGRPWEVQRTLDGTEIWLCGPVACEGVRGHLRSVLSPEERAQADRFVSARDRELYATAHGLLRLLLSSCLGIGAAELLFASGRWGKPHLLEGGEPGPGPAPWFNIAHSGERVLVALSSRCPVGVDLERHRHLRDALEIAGRFFGERECAFLRELPDEPRERAFFRIWSRKEAVVKAAGLSVAQLSRELEVLPAAGGKDGGRCELPEGEVRELFWRDLPMEGAYSAAWAAPEMPLSASLIELDPA